VLNYISLYYLINSV